MQLYCCAHRSHNFVTKTGLLGNAIQLIKPEVFKNGDLAFSRVSYKVVIYTISTLLMLKKVMVFLTEKFTQNVLSDRFNN